MRAYVRGKMVVISVAVEERFGFEFEGVGNWGWRGRAVEVVERLKGLAVPLREAMGDALTGVKAREARPLGMDE